MSHLGAIPEGEIMEGLRLWYLKASGLWGTINHFRRTGRRNLALRIQLAATLIINVPSVLFQVGACFSILIGIQKATIISSQVVPCLHVLTRHLVFWFHLGDQCRLYDLIRKDFLSSIPPHKRGNAREVYLRVSRLSNMLPVAVLSTNFVNAVLWICFPSYSVEYISSRTGDVATSAGGRYKNLGGWYPLPMAESPYFEGIFCYEVLMVAWVCGVVPVFLCAFFLPLACLSAHFEALGGHIAGLRADGTPGSSIRRELLAAIQDHRKLMAYAHELRKVYNTLVTVTLGMTIYMQIVCVFQFLYGEIKDVVYVLKFLQILAYSLFEVGMFCYGSSSLETASSALQDAIYSCEWYNADPQFRKTAQMVMIGCRKGITLTAIKVYPVNLETMLQIFQFTYTAAAVMSRIAE